MFAQSFQTAGLGGLSGTELLVVLGVAVLLFGGKKIPEVAKGLGEGIKNFKQALKTEEEPSVETKKQANVSLAASKSGGTVFERVGKRKNPRKRQAVRRGVSLFYKDVDQAF